MCLHCERRMTNGVYTPAHAVQAPAPNSSLDGALIEPQRLELAIGNQPVLPPRKGRHAHVRPGLGEMFSHTETNSPTPSIRPPQCPP
jgi:hypothetical protein